MTFRILAFAAALVVLGSAPTLAFADDLVIGEYTLSSPYSKAVIDGDTVRVDGLDSSLRLLGIDTEETFKGGSDKEESARNWKKYLRSKVEGNAIPVKFATPMGEEAKHFAAKFFKGSPRVRLELDDTARRRGYYNRFLVYVLIKKNGKWVNYNVEAVRAGMSPYFMKYGYSARFHKEFVAAQREAKAAKRGIWKKGAKGYPDYAKRLKWWTRRAEAIKSYREKFKGKDGYYEMGVEADWKGVIAAKGKKVIVFGTIGSINKSKDPWRAFIGHQKYNDFGIVSFKHDAFNALKLEKHMGEYIYVEGKVELYKGKPQFRADKGAIKIWRK